MARKKGRSVPRRQFGWGCFLLACAGCLLIGFGVGYWAQTEPGQAVLDEAAQQARTLFTDLTEGLQDPSTAPGTGPAVVAGEGSIEVWFGPVHPDDPLGKDVALKGLIRSARETLHGAFYDLQLESVAEALVERHRAGVEVALVSDSDYADQPGIRACLEAGIPVRFDERSAFMHNKFLVVDNETVWTGSANITRNGFYRNDNNSLIIRSPYMAHNYATEFLEMYQGQFGASSPANTPYPVLEIDGIRIETYFAPEDGVEDRLVAHLHDTDQRIAFMAFSFTSVPIAETMAARLEAGVEVTGVFEARNAGSVYSRDDFLAEAGAAIRLDGNPNSMHHKVMILDRERVVTGSYNFSNNANTRNDENVLIIHDTTLAEAYEAEFSRVWAEGR